MPSLTHASRLADHPVFLFAGGGSGGHLFPGIAVAEELTLRDPRSRVVFVGSERGVERTILAGTRWEHFPLPVRPPGTAKRHPIRFLGGLARSLSASWPLIDGLRPDAVIGLGGFASVPVGIAARLRGVPLIVLEQNVVPGRATSLLSRWAERVCVSFDETVRLLPRGVRTAVTGNPVRVSVRHSSPKRGRPTLLVLGGSQGAAGVNTMTVSAVAQLKERFAEWRVMHQAGERDVEIVRQTYSRHGIMAEVASFFDDLPNRYGEATLAISRSGATTLAELASVGLPAVLVPYPRSARDHQLRNAEKFSEAGAAMIVQEGQDAPERLAIALEELLDAPRLLTAMSASMRRLARPAAAESVANLLLSSAVTLRADRPAA